MKTTLRRVAASPMVRWILVAAWAGVIFAGSSVPGSDIPGGYSVYGHLAEYFVLGGLAAFAVGGPKRTAIGVALLLCAAYAASDEIHQAFVPMRMPDPLDWLTDMLGAAAGAASLTLSAAKRAVRTGPDRQ